MTNFFPMSGICTWVATPLHPHSHRKTKEKTMTDYTPTTGMVRARYCDATVRGERPDYHPLNVTPEEHEKNHAEFDRWFAEEIRKAKEQAWDEGHGEPKSCCGLCPRNHCPWDNGGNGPKNPYVEES